MNKAELKQLIQEVVNEVRRAPRVLPWHLKAADNMNGVWDNIEEIVPDLMQRIAMLDPTANGKVLPWHKKAAIAINTDQSDDGYDDSETTTKRTASIIARYDPANGTTPNDRPYTMGFLDDTVTVYAANKTDAIKQAIKHIRFYE